MLISPIILTITLSLRTQAKTVTLQLQVFHYAHRTLPSVLKIQQQLDAPYLLLNNCAPANPGYCLQFPLSFTHKHWTSWLRPQEVDYSVNNLFQCRMNLSCTVRKGIQVCLFVYSLCPTLRNHLAMTNCMLSDVFKYWCVAIAWNWNNESEMLCGSSPAQSLGAKTRATTNKKHPCSEEEGLTTTTKQLDTEPVQPFPPAASQSPGNGMNLPLFQYSAKGSKFLFLLLVGSPVSICSDGLDGNAKSEGEEQKLYSAKATSWLVIEHVCSLVNFCILSFCTISFLPL